MRILTLIPIAALSACGATTLPQVVTAPTQTGAPAADQPVAAVVPLAIAPTATQTATTALAPVATITPVATAAPESSTGDVSFATLLNNVRIGNGVGSVSYDARLDAAAQSYAEELLAQGRFSHTGADGSTPGTRATAAGYRWNYIAENIARGQQTETNVMDAWQRSDGHRRNNLDARAEDFGLGVAGTGSQKHWVLVFGREF